MNPQFWRGRRVLLTGHSGFKGAWASVVLSDLGAKVSGLSLAAGTDPSLWQMIKGRMEVVDTVTDLRDASAVAGICQAAAPEIVLHLAAQAQVRESYRDPVGTFGSNVQGTVNLLDALRTVPGIRAILAVTSDKVYDNADTGAVFAETSPLGGSDPYSASKGAAEIVVKSYADSFFTPLGIPVATARGGNVIGGGDFSNDRLVPDLYRAARAKAAVELRYPKATRPWQHVLDCLSGYFRFAEYLVTNGRADPHALNFGPLSDEAIPVADVADAMGTKLGNPQPWVQTKGPFPAEKQTLRLDSTMATRTLAWQPRLDAMEAIDWTAEWYANFAAGKDALELTRAQIARYLA